MQATCSSETSSTFLSMEKTRRKSSASEFFSRRHSSSLFQSMRRYSSSTLFSSGAGAGPSSWRSAGGRRHSSSQLVPSPAHQLQGDTARPALGDVAELQETGRQIHTGAQKAVSLVLEQSCLRLETRNGEYGHLVLFPLDFRTQM